MIDVVDKPRQGTLDPALKVQLDDPHARRGYVYCATCSHIITHIDHRIEAGGAHQHHFVNPHGYHFQVACYSQALGCAISGPPVAADTWFPAHRWQQAQCEECGIHLGWFFTDTSNHSFFGLIIDQIQTD